MRPSRPAPSSPQLAYRETLREVAHLEKPEPCRILQIGSLRPQKAMFKASQSPDQGGSRVGGTWSLSGPLRTSGHCLSGEGETEPGEGQVSPAVTPRLWLALGCQRAQGHGGPRSC